jgi:hypothetical protein
MSRGTRSRENGGHRGSGAETAAAEIRRNGVEASPRPPTVPRFWGYRGRTIAMKNNSYLGNRPRVPLLYYNTLHTYTVLYMYHICIYRSLGRGTFRGTRGRFSEKHLLDQRVSSAPAKNRRGTPSKKAALAGGLDERSAR